MREDITPIVMTTYNRADYLRRSIESLENSDADLRHFYIFDDCSDQKEKITLLDGLQKKYKVEMSTENQGTVKNTVPNIYRIYDLYKTDVFLLQDDIVLNKNWYSKAVDLFREIKNKHHKIGMMSLYNRTMPVDVEYSIMRHGHPGFVANIFSSDFLEDYKEKWDINDYIIDAIPDNAKVIGHKIRNLVDYKFCNRLHRMEWNIAVIGKSLVQHTGKISTLSNKDMGFCTINNFVGE